MLGSTDSRCVHRTMYETLENIPNAWSIKVPVQHSFHCHKLQVSVMKQNWVTRWVLRRQSFFCCCLCRCCSGSRRSTAFQNVMFLKKSSVDHFMEPSVDILDTENIMIVRAASRIHLLPLRKLRDLKRSQVPAFHPRQPQAWRKSL